MKPWYLSKTIWANIIAAVALVLNSSAQVVSSEEIAGVTVVVNLILRAITSKGLHVRQAPFVIMLCAFLFSSCATPPPGYEADTTPGHNGAGWIGGRESMPDRSSVQVRATNGGAAIGIDWLGIRNYQPAEWARNVSGPLKILTYPADYVGYMVTEHPVQSLTAGLLLWEAADNGVSDTLGGLFGGGGDNGGSGKASSPEFNTGTNVVVTGANNTVTVSPNNSSVPAPAPVAEAASE